MHHVSGCILCSPGLQQCQYFSEHDIGLQNISLVRCFPKQVLKIVPLFGVTSVYSKDGLDGIIHIERQVEDTESMIGANKKLGD
jgi:hypothetical protein